MASNDYFCVMNMLHNQSKDLVEKNYYYFVKITITRPGRWPRFPRSSGRTTRTISRGSS